MQSARLFEDRDRAAADIVKAFAAFGFPQPGAVRIVERVRGHGGSHSVVRMAFEIAEIPFVNSGNGLRGKTENTRDNFAGFARAGEFAGEQNFGTEFAGKTQSELVRLAAAGFGERNIVGIRETPAAIGLGFTVPDENEHSFRYTVRRIVAPCGRDSVAVR